MKKITMYECEYCGEKFLSEEYCLKHEEKESSNVKANKMLHEGRTLKEINEECKIWNELPEYLEEVTEDNCFVISHWQCCEKPAYQIQKIEVGGRLFVSGVGSWYGAYGGYLPINDHHLKRPYGKDKLYVYR